MSSYRNDSNTTRNKRNSLAPLWTGAMSALAFAVVFLVMFRIDPATRQTASNATVPGPTVATFTFATDQVSK